MDSIALYQRVHSLHNARRGVMPGIGRRSGNTNAPADPINQSIHPSVMPTISMPPSLPITPTHIHHFPRHHDPTPLPFHQVVPSTPLHLDDTTSVRRLATCAATSPRTTLASDEVDEEKEEVHDEVDYQHEEAEDGLDCATDKTDQAFEEVADA